MKPVSIVVADDHAVVRGGISHLLSQYFTDATFVECTSGDEVVKRVKDTPCDLLIMDIAMPHLDGLEVLSQIKPDHPNLPVIILTAFTQGEFAKRAFKLGASAYLQKASANEELVDAARTVLEGQRYIPPALEAILNNLPPSLIELLSDREHTIFLMLAKGKSLKEIAYELTLSPKTVTTYRSRILTKLNLTSNAAIAQTALKLGLVE